MEFPTISQNLAKKLIGLPRQERAKTAGGAVGEQFAEAPRVVFRSPPLGCVRADLGERQFGVHQVRQEEARSYDLPGGGLLAARNGIQLWGGATAPTS